MDNWSNKIHEVLVQEVFNFHIDSYQFCKNWLKARQGCPLSNEENQRYQHIVMLLKEMVKLMEEIKTAIQYDQLKKLEIFEKVRAIIVDKLEIAPDKVTPASNFVEDLRADSLDTVKIVMALEEAFKIKISEQFIETIVTVQQIINYISQKVEATG